MFQPQENLICNHMNLLSFREYLLLENEEWKVTYLELDHKVNTRAKLQQNNTSTSLRPTTRKWSHFCLWPWHDLTITINPPKNDSMLEGQLNYVF